MGDLTKAELREELNKNLGDKLGGLSPANLTAAQSRMDRALNLAQTWIARQHTFKEMYRQRTLTTTFVAVPATDRVFTGVPATMQKINTIVHLGDDDGITRKLTFVHASRWDAIVPYADDLLIGRVTHYTTWRTDAGVAQIEWWRVPDGQFSFIMRYTAWPASFASDSAMSEYEKKDELILARATEWFFRSTGAIEDSKDWGAERKELMANAILDDRKTPDYTPQGHWSNEGEMGGPDYWLDPFQKESP